MLRQLLYVHLYGNSTNSEKNNLNLQHIAIYRNISLTLLGACIWLNFLYIWSQTPFWTDIAILQINGTRILSVSRLKKFLSELITCKTVSTDFSRVHWAFLTSCDYKTQHFAPFSWCNTRHMVLVTKPVSNYAQASRYAIV